MPSLPTVRSGQHLQTMISIYSNTIPNRRWGTRWKEALWINLSLKYIEAEIYRQIDQVVASHTPYRAIQINKSWIIDNVITAHPHGYQVSSTGGQLQPASNIPPITRYSTDKFTTWYTEYSLSLCTGRTKHSTSQMATSDLVVKLLWNGWRGHQS